MKAACDYCTRTAQGTMDKLMGLGWSWATIQHPFRRRFVACWRHGDLLAADVDAALQAHKRAIDKRWKP